MNRPPPISAALVHSRWGRAALHLLCLVRGGPKRWHLRGIVRELFRPRRSQSGSRGHSLCAFLLCALLGGGFPVFAFTGSPALILLPAAQVDGSGIYLHQLASTSLSIPIPQTIRLASAPAFGQAASFSREQIGELLKSLAPEFASTNWSGAFQVRVTRRVRPLAEAELRDLLTATLQKERVQDRGELELRFMRPWAPVNVPDEMLLLKVVDLPASGVGPNFIVKFELIAGADRLGPWQAVLQARVMKDILVTCLPIRRGQPLAEGEFAIERRDVLSLREPLDESALKNPSLDLVEAVPAGQPLLARSVRMRPVVRRGQMVDGLVRDGALNISLKVEALADGLPGQIVRVRNPKTKREFYAKVQDEQVVVINL